MMIFYSTNGQHNWQKRASRGMAMLCMVLAMGILPQGIFAQKKVIATLYETEYVLSVLGKTEVKEMDAVVFLYDNMDIRMVPRDGKEEYFYRIGEIEILPEDETGEKFMFHVLDEDGLEMNIIVFKGFKQFIIHILPHDLWVLYR